MTAAAVPAAHELSASYQSLGQKQCRSLPLSLRLAAAGAAALVLSACAPGDVELQGKIFDAVGISGGQQGGGRVVKLADRAPLVVPPDANRLPPPGETGSTDAPDALAAIDDPDRKRLKTKAELERQQAEYCRVNYELPKARGDASAASAKGPLGPCAPSIFSAIKRWNASDADEE
jgi:hypothetical protein